MFQHLRISKNLLISCSVFHKVCLFLLLTRNVHISHDVLSTPVLQNGWLGIAESKQSCVSQTEVNTPTEGHIPNVLHTCRT